jgi:hypothetical protein
MPNHDSINNSFDSFRSLRRDIDALNYLASLIPDEDPHHSLIYILADRLDQNATALHNHLCPLWAEISSIDKSDNSQPLS